jgi:hypothetical protein
MSQKAVSQHPGTLEEARELFAAWRNKPHRTRKIPEDLWNVAISLCRRYSICAVSKALRLSYKDLRIRVRENYAALSPRPFVDLGMLLPPQVGMVVECEDGARNRMRIQCSGPMDSGVVDLVKTFLATGR